MKVQDIFLSQNKERILEKYQKLDNEFPQIFGEISKKMQGLNERVSLACKYLYGTMPFSDMGNYSFEIFLDYAEQGVLLWEELEDVRCLPELIYLNYVLGHRVNEEEIAPCRSLFYQQLRPLVQGKGTKDAALEVNYWCVGEASYHSTDDRTLSAWSVYQRGNGRCGEESVFTVNALRSVGIPARQVYAPKWSHCDDNHAWVEIWCDGVWYFMGACEPEQILNKGWFTNASSRAMMVHSRWFDSVSSGEEVIGKDGMVTMENELSRYALTKSMTVKVQDENKNPVPGAAVALEVLNYSEYAPVAEGMTDSTGMVRFTVGFGSVHIWVEKDGLYGQSHLDMNAEAAEQDCEITLGCYKPENIWKPVDMTAPLDAPVNTDQPTAQQKEVGNLRLAQLNEKRREKTAQWTNPEIAAFLKLVSDEEGIAQKHGAAEADTTTAETIETAAEKADTFRLRKKLLYVLTEKDQTDCVAEVLEEHLQEALRYAGDYDEKIFVPYILNPRVDDEVLKPYRRLIRETFTQEEQNRFRENPKTIWNIVDTQIVSHPEGERTSVITVPAGCIKLGIGSPLSKKILFVAIARTFGIPARLNPSDCTMEYWENGAFVPVLPESVKDCQLQLSAYGQEDHLSDEQVIWKYFQNWSLARLEKNSFVSLKLGDQIWENGRLDLQLEAGQYRLLTSNRLTNGSIFAYEYEFQLEAGEKKEIQLRLREAKLADMLEHISLPEFNVFTEENISVKGSVLTGKGKQILLFLEESKEPTEHILNEMREQKEGFAKQAEHISFVVRSKEALEDPVISGILKLFPRISVYYDDFSENIELLARRMYVDPDKLPLIIVTEGSLNGIYAASGYNVGTGDMLLRVMEA